MQCTDIRRESKEWKDIRFNYVTGTDVGKIMLCDSTCSREKLFKCKLYHTDPCDNVNSYTKTLLELGKSFEELALDDFKMCPYSKVEDLENGFVPTIFRHNNLIYLYGTPDYILPGKKELLEIKTHFYPSIFNALPITDRHSIPMKYYLQIQAYLEILDYNKAYLWSWTLNNGASLFIVYRDKSLFNGVIKGIIEFFYSRLESARECQNLEQLQISKSLRAKRGEAEILHAKISDSIEVSTSEIGHFYPEFRNKIEF